MGFYDDKVLPHIINVACGMKVTHPLRRRACEGLTGAVVEIGFGSGHNAPFYTPAITSVAAVEPSALAWRLAQKRVQNAAVPIERSGPDGASLPFPDDSFDSALSTFTLCTIPNVEGALKEIRRVLKPGSALHFLEHGLAPDARVRRWQHRLDPLEQRLFGGCHLDRPIIDLIRDAGFTISEVEEFYQKGAPKTVGADSLGVAMST
jgi:ubiquinone/menaquinone biosynthesis C-methylase UbiE